MGFTVLLLGLGLSGCLSTDELSAFERIAGTQMTTINRFDDISPLQLNDQMVNQLNTTQSVTLSMTLDTSNELTNREKIDNIVLLYQNISSARTRNVTLGLEIKDLWAMTKENVNLFKASELTLTEADKTIITDYKVVLRIEGLLVKDTIGDIQVLVQEIKDNFDLEHLDLITTNFEQILEILTLRYDFMILLQSSVTDVNNIILTYLV